MNWLQDFYDWLGSWFEYFARRFDRENAHLAHLQQHLRRIDAALEEIRKLVVSHPASLRATHGGAQPEGGSDMSKPKSLGFAKPKHRAGAATAPAGDKDTCTIAVLDQQGNPYTGPDPTITAVPSDATIVTTDPPSGLTYGEHFLKAGTTNVHIEATFPDGTKLLLDDTVTVTGVPGSLVATHSAPVVGP